MAVSIPTVQDAGSWDGAVADPKLKSLRSPDDVFRMDKIEERSVQMGEQTIGRATLQPGWRWSVHVKPVVGTPSCTFRHLGLTLSGRLHVRMDDGREFEVGPDDAFDIPPGHDAWVAGSDPFESVEIAGIYGFGRRAAGESYVTSVLLTDIVDSTATLERLGDPQWRTVLNAHFEQARRAFDRYRGVEVATTGDGILATFDSAARAVRAAADIHVGSRQLGVRVRAGIHTGEVEPVPGNVRGIAVHIAARIAAAAAAGETLVSSTTREMISAGDVAFDDRGLHELKGITGSRQLYAARVVGDDA
jgi:class 3 adenylate cyclase